MYTIDQYDRENLILLIQAAEPHVSNEHNALQQIMQIRNYILQQSTILSRKPKHITGTALAVTLSISLLLSCCFVTPLLMPFFQTEDFSDSASKKLILSILLILMLIGGIIALINLFYHLSYKSSLKKYQSDLTQAQASVQELTHYIQHNLALHTELQIIPIAYHSSNILNTIKSYLVNYRASNWKEAVNLYEQEQQLQQINNTLKQSIYQNQQLMMQEITLLKSIKSDINFNALATAGILFFK